MNRKFLDKIVPTKVVDIKKQIFNRLDDIEREVRATQAQLSHHDYRLDELREAIKKVEPYQPIYGLPTLIEGARRTTRDRCDAMLGALGGSVSSLRMLDIGSSLGYVSFYFADRGARVEGWEYNADNVSVTQLAQGLNGVELARFKTKEFDQITVEHIHTGDVDVAIMLSVVHHIIQANGLEYAKRLMKELTERVPILLVELARKGEDTQLRWDEAQPDRELDVFADCDVIIQKIDEFSTHLSSQARPLYKISSRHVLVNNRPYAIVEDVRFEAYKNSPVRGRISGATRRYYNTKSAFVKEYILEPENRSEHRSQIINELSVNIKLDRVFPDSRIPRLIDFEIAPNSVKLAYEKIDGRLLDDASDLVSRIGVATIATQLAGCLADIESQGYQHNDIRSWNVMLADDGAHLIDLALASPIASENNAVAFLWAMHAAITGRRESYEQGKTELPQREAFLPYPGLMRAYDAAERHEESFATLADLLRES